MSASQRSSRSRSKPVTDNTDKHKTRSAQPDIEEEDDSDRFSSPAPIPQLDTSSNSNARHNTSDSDTSATMLSALSTKEVPSVQNTPNGTSDGAPSPDGSRSSSLSDPEDAVEDREDSANAKGRVSLVAEENDSEAETERINATPHKAQTTVIGDGAGLITSRSGLVNVETEVADAEALADTLSPTPSATPDELGITTGGKPGQELLAKFAPLTDASDGAVEGLRKRKRSLSEHATLDPEMGMPSPPKKRASSLIGDSRINGEALLRESTPVLLVTDEAGDVPVEEEVPMEKSDAIEAPDDDDDDESSEPLVTQLRNAKAQKGKRKAKKYKESETVEETEDAPEDDEVVDGEADEDDPAAVEEEMARWKDAMQHMHGIERQLNALRRNILDERIGELDKDIELLQKPGYEHPELAAMMRCIDDRRDGKIQLENIEYGYREQALNTRFVAERVQAHSQYFQSVRDIREAALASISEHMFKIQKERRNFGADDHDYTQHFNPKRSEQIRQQMAYNQEVSILSGIAKYVGFPAAPGIPGARAKESLDDLKEMRIPVRSAPSMPARKQSGVGAGMQRVASSGAPGLAAIPQYQLAQSGPPHQAPTRVVSRASPFMTPVNRQRSMDGLAATNGSASTIDALSNPASGNAPRMGSLGQSDAQDGSWAAHATPLGIHQQRAALPTSSAQSTLPTSSPPNTAAAPNQAPQPHHSFSSPSGPSGSATQYRPYFASSTDSRRPVPPPVGASGESFGGEPRRPPASEAR